MISKELHNRLFQWTPNNEKRISPPFATNCFWIYFAKNHINVFSGPLYPFTEQEDLKKDYEDNFFIASIIKYDHVWEKVFYRNELYEIKIEALLTHDEACIRNYAKYLLKKYH